MTAPGMRPSAPVSSSESAAAKLPGADTRGHPAFTAWRAVEDAAARPTTIELLSVKRKSEVYRLEAAASNGSSIIAKHCFHWGLSTERIVYEEVLSAVPGLGPAYFGCLEEEGPEHRNWYWLFLEDVGEDPYRHTDPNHRLAAVLRLAKLHASTADQRPSDRLPERADEHYANEMRLAADAIRAHLGDPALSSSDCSTLEGILLQLEQIGSLWPEIEATCNDLPRTVAHGDFFPANLRVRDTAPGVDLVALDWESAGWASPAVDLAMFSGADQQELLSAYWTAVRPCWPEMGLDRVVGASRVGALFRQIASIRWESSMLAFDSLTESMANMRIYQRKLEAGLKAIRETSFRTDSRS